MKNICIVVLAFLLVSCGQGGINGKFVIDENSIVIDVRTDQEYKAGHLKNSINIPYDQIKDKIKEHVKDEDDKIILYCRSGRRSGIAQNVLKKMGYKNVVNAGAYKKLKKKNQEVISMGTEFVFEDYGITLNLLWSRSERSPGLKIYHCNKLG